LASTERKRYAEAVSKFDRRVFLEPCALRLGAFCDHCVVRLRNHKMSKEYTLEDTKKHNKETDLWIVWRGKVLDLTKFVNEHPGGVDVLMETAGGDATQGFDDIGHSSDAIKLAGEHVIGVLKGAAVQESAPKVRLALSILSFEYLSFY
jgi:cytochrome b involved in lipid metabolism